MNDKRDQFFLLEKKRFKILSSNRQIKIEREDRYAFVVIYI